MSKNTLVIASLNLWGYNKWEERFPRIIETIKEASPDIIFFQEVQRNPLFSDLNQLEIINEQLAYPYSFFGEACIKKTHKGNILPYPVNHGLGILSKFPCTSEIIKLTQGVKEPRIILKNTLDTIFGTFTATNVHFENNDEWSEKHLVETLEMLKSVNPASIIVGDFNIKHLEKYSRYYSEKYTASCDVVKYISYPEDNLSYDYVLLPKQYTYQKFDCLQKDISDHCMIVTHVEI